MLNIAPTTELEALNSMLGTISEAPVNTTNVPETSDAAIALTILREVCRGVQTRGWNFNTERCYPLSKDNAGLIRVPANTSHVVFSKGRYTDCDPVLRGTDVYDRKGHTYTFTRDLEAAEIVLLLTFDKLPQAARHYVTIRACRVFADRVQGSVDVHRFTDIEESAALNQMVQDDGSADQPNIFDDPSMFWMTRGNRQWA